MRDESTQHIAFAISLVAICISLIVLLTDPEDNDGLVGGGGGPAKFGTGFDPQHPRKVPPTPHYTELRPFAGPDGRRWAIPWEIVRCETEGKFRAELGGLGGAYLMRGIRDTTPPAEQHRAAAELREEAGFGQWACAHYVRFGIQPDFGKIVYERSAP